jgi:hypothetical protein
MPVLTHFKPVSPEIVMVTLVSPAADADLLPAPPFAWAFAVTELISVADTKNSAER